MPFKTLNLAKPSTLLTIGWAYLTIVIVYRNYSFIYEPLNVVRNTLMLLIPVICLLAIEQAKSLPLRGIFRAIGWIFAVISLGFLFIGWFGAGELERFQGKHYTAPYESCEVLKNVLVQNNSQAIVLEKFTNTEAIEPTGWYLDLKYVRNYWNFLNETKLVCRVSPGRDGTFELSADKRKLTFIIEPKGSSRKTTITKVFSTNWNEVERSDCD